LGTTASFSEGNQEDYGSKKEKSISRCLRGTGNSHVASIVVRSGVRRL
jgi:hypothetical protein